MEDVFLFFKDFRFGRLYFEFFVVVFILGWGLGILVYFGVGFEKRSVFWGGFGKRSFCVVVI